MAKFYGAIGFARNEMTKPGVWTNNIIERNYRGDLLKNNRSFQNSGNVNDNITISNEISIVADIFANEHSSDIRYVVLRGKKWKVTNVNVQYPRLILSVGGVYNG